MKIKGVVLSIPCIEIIPILRGESTIYLRAQAVTDMAEFDALCPEPQPPWLQKAGEAATKDYNNSKYRDQLNEYGRKRLSYMIIKSLEATDGLEWDTVKMANPDTWGNYDTELRESGFAEAEIARIIRGVMDANSLNEDKVEEARKSFLASQRQDHVA